MLFGTFGCQSIDRLGKKLLIYLPPLIMSIIKIEYGIVEVKKEK